MSKRIVHFGDGTPDLVTEKDGLEMLREIDKHVSAHVGKVARVRFFISAGQAVLKGDDRRIDWTVERPDV
jgi:hypothetical protein